jgi:hypothetical protein
MTALHRAGSRLLLAGAVLLGVASVRGAPALTGELGQPSRPPDSSLSQPRDGQSVAFLRAGADTFRAPIGGQRSRDSRSAWQTPAPAAGSGLARALLLGGSIHLLRSNARSVSRRLSRAPRAPPHLLAG